MFDERAFINRVEAADPEELAALLTRPVAEEEKALRVHLGDARYQRMHSLALKRTVTRRAGKKGNVIVIHGIMGSELTCFNAKGNADQIWLKVLRIISGQLDRFRLGEDGRTSEYDVRPTGIMKRYYGELLLSLSQEWNVRAFWFDWRKDLDIAADELAAHISGWFEPTTPFHIVAHSMGGLVARTYIKRHPQRWKAMWGGGATVSKIGGRLIMLGTPNHGSFASVQVLTGLEGIVKKLALLDLYHNREELLRILNSFVGTYQMLPSPLVLKTMAPLYLSETYSGLNVTQRHLDNARRHHEWLSDVVDPERMIYVAGYNQPTISNITNLNRVCESSSYEVSLAGDGRVPHELGRLSRANGQEEVPMYFIDEDHGELPTNDRILGVLDELLEVGTTNGLSHRLPAGYRGPAGTEPKRASERLRKLQVEDEDRLKEFAKRMRSRGADPASTVYVSFEERKAEEILTRGILSYRAEDERRFEERGLPMKPATIQIRLVHGKIEDIGVQTLTRQTGDPVDAISVGHYVGVKPQAAEKALDEAISRTLIPGGRNGKELAETDLLLTQYTERGIIRGELGQPFFLVDPRTTRRKKAVTRLVAIAGMGVPGRFGMPELVVLVRELCWSLGRMGKRHLATVPIGMGNGNLSIRDAISGWLRGVKLALTGLPEGERRRLRRITFVEFDPSKMGDLQCAIVEEKDLLAQEGQLLIDFQPLGNDELKQLKQDSGKWGERRRKRRSPRQVQGRPIPTRVTVELDGETYRFGAITEIAAIPERQVPLDPKLVNRANDELAAEFEPAMQLERGQFLEKLLIPDDLRPQLYTGAPLVMMVDATMARIHWEIIAQSDSPPSGGQTSPEDYFLGTSRGFTRQLRSQFAAPPEPPPPPRRLLRVLVVADPAEDAPLPGAEAEGVEVADLFESFNTVWRQSESRVEVVRLFGPSEATRTNVLRELMLRTYDVLHFAGHCLYDRQNPAKSGWIFTGGERLSANELTRIDRIPKFVFSNACESGITPDRSEKRSVELAPSFAEAFFARGVSNFVCTAWPVDDVAAREFAICLYAALLGVGVMPQGGTPRAVKPEAMYEAMQKARLAIAKTPYGIRTWGAYQHYGNPYFQFFDSTSMSPSRSASGRK